MTDAARPSEPLPAASVWPSATGANACQRSSVQVDEAAVDAAFRSVDEHFALFGSLHGQAVPISDAQVRDILRGAIITYLGATSDPRSAS